MSNNQQTIVYIMRHIDSGGYIEEIPYKKIGITGAGNATLTSRLQQISNTKSPIKAQCIAAWSHTNARDIENALHLLLDDIRIEGEWFLDKDDTLVERMQPVMDLLGAKEIEIESASDSYTKQILQKEGNIKQELNRALLGEITELLTASLRTSIRKAGVTLFSDKTHLTYYIGRRKSGNHNLSIGRSANIYDEISTFLETAGYDVDQSAKGSARIMGVTTEVIAEIVNKLESDFSSS
ncbi:GIY-YIG nuclease family protein [Teredinibacter sp. KSP-S5-2]|uniref:GIY-YIG nuclease family protein n=1 Tax=Teredinibacter sp. KSP-S5-2 TaxID=3034506 RepID=UPI002934B3B4|nr:GIY-YIG nuclease family protein [Teredinibacter sp. KSP-S5-2]WNO11646.1 GIY-YIG nuclease family protein [Teredinibacter sp. KSP-S5-2]